MPAPKGKSFPERGKGQRKKGPLNTLEKLEGDNRSPLPIAKRREIVWDYMIDGVQTRVAERHGIHYTTIGKWKKTEWWHDMMKEAQEEYEDKLRARMNKVIDKALRETEERLESGDPIFDTKRGKINFMPVKAKDAATIAAMQYDKRRLSLNLPTSIGGQSGSKQIEALAEKFADLAKNFQYKQVRDANAIEGEFTENRPPERPLETSSHPKEG